MKRTVTALGIAGTLVLGPLAISAQAGETHHGQHAQKQGQSKGHRCTCRKPHPKPPVCRPNCAGHGDQGHHPRKPVCHKPHHPKPKPPKPPCHHGHKPPHKPPVKPPVVHPRPPIQTHPKPASHVEGHKKHPATTVQLTALPRTGPADVALIGGAGLLFLVTGTGAFVAGSRKQGQR